MPYPERVDEILVGALRRLPSVVELDSRATRALFERAEHHGVAGVLTSAYRARGVALDDAISRRAIARELDHAAHLAALRVLDVALRKRGVTAVVLKGVSVGLRYYEPPSNRSSSDIDLLVRPDEVEPAAAALASLGYVLADSDAKRRWSRTEHHHDLFTHPASIPVELHFLAYRGFGAAIESGPLLDLSEALVGFSALRALDPVDELAYLCVHASAHRFGRIGWLYDVWLAARAHRSDTLSRAAARAAEWGYGRAVAFAAVLLAELFGFEASGFGDVGSVRKRLLRALVHEPTNPWGRAATRFAYSALLADSVGQSLRYARIATLQRARSAAGRSP